MIPSKWRISSIHGPFELVTWWESQLVENKGYTQTCPCYDDDDGDDDDDDDDDGDGAGAGAGDDFAVLSFQTDHIYLAQPWGFWPFLVLRGSGGRSCQVELADLRKEALMDDPQDIFFNTILLSLRLSMKKHVGPVLYVVAINNLELYDTCIAWSFLCKLFFTSS